MDPDVLMERSLRVFQEVELTLRTNGTLRIDLRGRCEPKFGPDIFKNWRMVQDSYRLRERQGGNLVDYHIYVRGEAFKDPELIKEIRSAFLLDTPGWEVLENGTDSLIELLRKLLRGKSVDAFLETSKFSHVETFVGDDYVTKKFRAIPPARRWWHRIKDFMHNR